MLTVLCPKMAIEKTLTFLQDAGRSRQECVVLWLGRRKTNQIEVCEVLRPAQRARSDMFHITPASMADILDHLRRKRLMITAQVHSHPGQAFHSAADDAWAIVRHIGALSIVLPDFALRTTPPTFLRDAAVFNLSPENRWIKALDGVLEVA